MLRRSKLAPSVDRGPGGVRDPLAIRPTALLRPYVRKQISAYGPIAVANLVRGPWYRFAMETKVEPVGKKKRKSWPPRGQTAKNPQKVYTVTAERRPDGTRVERTYDETGALKDEWEATLHVQQLGSDDKGAIYIIISIAAPPDFQFANATIKAAGGKFGGRTWRLPAKTGLEVVEQLRSEGFVIVRDNQLDIDESICAAVMTKFVGPLNYRHGGLTVTLTPEGFGVETSDGGSFRCSVGEAFLLDQYGRPFTQEALVRIREIRSTVGFPTLPSETRGFVPNEYGFAPTLDEL